MEDLINQINQKYNFNPKLEVFSPRHGEANLRQVLIDNQFPETNDPRLLEVYGLYFLYIDVQDEKGKEFMEKSIELGSVDAMCMYGNYLRSKNNELCIKYFDMAVQQGCIDSAHNLGNYYNVRNNPLCEKYLLIGVDQDDYDCISELVKYYYRKKDWDNYLIILNKGLKHSPGKNHNFLGLHYDRFHEKNKAIEHYLKAIEYGNVEAYYNLGMSYCEKGDWKNMKKYYKLGAEKKEVSCLYELARYYCSRKVYKSREYAEELYLLEPKNLDCIVLLGEIYDKLKLYSQMIKVLKEGVELDSDLCCMNLGQYYFNNNKYHESIFHYQKALDLGNNKAAFHIARCYEKLEDDVNAEKYYKLCTLPEGIYNLCLFYKKRKRYESFVEQLVKIVNTPYQFYLEDCLETNIHLTYFSALNNHRKDYYIMKFVQQEFDKLTQDLIRKYNRELKLILEEYYMMKFQKLKTIPVFQFPKDVKIE